eukprot:1162062-Pelagomonas_calceolata.AAC.27
MHVHTRASSARTLALGHRHRLLPEGSAHTEHSYRAQTCNKHTYRAQTLVDAGRQLWYRALKKHATKCTKSCMRAHAGALALGHCHRLLPEPAEGAVNLFEG